MKFPHDEVLQAAVEWKRSGNGNLSDQSRKAFVLSRKSNKSFLLRYVQQSLRFLAFLFDRWVGKLCMRPSRWAFWWLLTVKLLSSRFIASSSKHKKAKIQSNLNLSKFKVLLFYLHLSLVTAFLVNRRIATRISRSIGEKSRGANRYFCAVHIAQKGCWDALATAKTYFNE